MYKLSPAILFKYLSVKLSSLRKPSFQTKFKFKFELKIPRYVLFWHKGCSFNVLKALGKNIQSNISHHFVISEFDIMGVYINERYTNANKKVRVNPSKGKKYQSENSVQHQGGISSH